MREVGSWISGESVGCWRFSTGVLNCLGLEAQDQDINSKTKTKTIRVKTETKTKTVTPRPRPKPRIQDSENTVSRRLTRQCLEASHHCYKVLFGKLEMDYTSWHVCEQITVVYQEPLVEIVPKILSFNCS